MTGGTREKLQFETGESFARRMDQEDPLAAYRKEFLFPQTENTPEDKHCIYLSGNSLGLQPKATRAYINEELEDWSSMAVEGHFNARHPWLPYHENLTDMCARLVGAKPIEVVAMNTLTVNLHLMMVSFYRPTTKRFKIIIEGGAFPSDKYAVDSQASFHGYDPKEAIIELKPRTGEDTLRNEDILDIIEKNGESVSLIMLGQVNYLTGQAFDIPAIVQAGHNKGCMVGFNLAHGAGNLLLKLHDWDVDFAVWCGYKYLNGGPGALAGCFVHERHAKDSKLPRFAGWWGHEKTSRFKMGPDFQAIAGAEGWQLSNPPIFQLAALRASLELFDRATMSALRAKSEKLTGYLEFLLANISNNPVTQVTPKDPAARGCQLSLRVRGNGKQLIESLASHGVTCDFREPDIMRAAPAPLYNSFMDVYRFAQVITEHAGGK